MANNNDETTIRFRLWRIDWNNGPELTVQQPACCGQEVLTSGRIWQGNRPF